MRNTSPRPVACALCETDDVRRFSVERMWVWMPASGIVGDFRWLFAVCNECLDKRHVRFEPHHSPEIDNRTGVWVYGEPTLADLERRLDGMKADIDVLKAGPWIGPR